MKRAALFYSLKHPALLTFQPLAKEAMSPPTKRQKMEGKRSGSPSVVNITNSGDLTVIVGDGEMFDQVRFNVERAALCLMSPVWNAMLDPTKPYKEASAKEVPFPEDNPEALEPILHIAHLNFSKVSTTFSVEELIELAILCDKYDIAEKMELFVKNSLHVLSGFSAKSSSRVIDRIMAAWVLGERDAFGLGVDYLFRHCSVEKGAIHIQELVPSAAVLPTVVTGRF